MNQVHKGRKVWIWIAAACLAAAGILAAVLLLRKREGSEQAGGKRPNVITLARMDLTNSISATGTLESVKTKKVSADVTQGKIRSVKVSVGDKVKKGQTLVVFDTDDLQKNLTEAKASLSDTSEQNSRQLASAERKLSEAEKAYKKAASEKKAGESPSRSDIQAAKDEVESVKASNRKSLREAQKSVDEAEEALKDCTVTAPMGGTVTAVGAAKGDSYGGGALVEISDLTNLQVSTTVSEYDISQVKKGQKVVILTDATGDTEIEGKISYVAMTAGNSTMNTNTENGGESGGASSSDSSSSSGYEVHIRLTKPEKELRAGMTAKCSIVLKEASDVYAVPYDAIHKSSSGEVIYVWDSDTGSQKEVAVTKGMESDYYVEVEGEELSEGMQVILPSDVMGENSSEEESRNTDLPDMMRGMPGGGDGWRRTGKAGGAR